MTVTVYQVYHCGCVSKVDGKSICLGSRVVAARAEPPVAAPPRLARADQTASITSQPTHPAVHRVPTHINVSQHCLSTTWRKPRTSPGSTRRHCRSEKKRKPIPGGGVSPFSKAPPWIVTLIMAVWISLGLEVVRADVSNCLR